MVLPPTFGGEIHRGPRGCRRQGSPRQPHSEFGSTHDSLPPATARVVSPHVTAGPAVAVSDPLVTPRQLQRIPRTFLSEFTAVKPVVVAPVTAGGQCRWCSGRCGCRGVRVQVAS